MSRLKGSARLLLCVAVLMCGHALAQQCNVQQLPADAGNYDVALALAKQCVGDKGEDNDQVVADFETATPDASTAQQRLDAMTKALTRLRDFVRSRAHDSVDVAAWSEALTELNDELNVATDTNHTLEQRLGAIRSSFWQLPPVGDAPVLNDTIRIAQPMGCRAPPTSCPAYDSRVNLLRVLKLMNRLVGYVDYPQLQAHFADSQLMTARWDAYFNRALPQYWWEVAVNGFLMDQHEHAWEAPFRPFVKDKNLCAVDPATKIQMGFCKVPQSQLILLHPSAAMQWVNGAHNTDELAPAFVVEVFGRNAWSWQNDAMPHHQFGWSLIAAYSNPDKDVKQWSYGVMLHKGGRLNLGITTDGHDQISVLVNIPLAEKIFARKAEYLDFLKALEKPTWESLL